MTNRYFGLAQMDTNYLKFRGDTIEEIFEKMSTVPVDNINIFEFGILDLQTNELVFTGSEYKGNEYFVERMLMRLKP